jgi:hypothetical protein
VLTVKAGSTSATLQLAGNYTSGSFQTEKLTSGTGVVFVASGGAVQQVMFAEVGSVGSAGGLAAAMFSPVGSIQPPQMGVPEILPAAYGLEPHPETSPVVLLPHVQ